MCGITGVMGRADAGSLIDVAAEMAISLRHRGPDQEGSWQDEQGQVAFGFRRLAVIDPTPAGYQPMRSVSGRCVIVFNGEIYNHNDLRRQLPVRFRGESDTETLVEAIDHWGVQDALDRVNGMFSLAVWDDDGNILSLARDRIGEKPLYYGWVKGRFVFASQVSSFHSLPGFEGEIDRSVLASYFRYGYVPSPHSIYKGILKLQPGHLVQVRPGDGPTESRPARYWSLDLASTRMGDEASLVDELDDLLTDAIRLRLISDVPLGAFLSGGIDSSTVVALMQRLLARPVRTFSVGFRDGDFDEAGYARRVANHLGTEHTELYVSSKEARAIIPKLPRLYDEPFADSSQIPMHLISQLARRHVTVALSGDGGDELFGGYTRYLMHNQTWRFIEPVPLRLRKKASDVLAWGGRTLSEQSLQTLNSLLPASWRQTHVREKLAKAAEVLRLKDESEVYQRLVSQWDDPTVLVRVGYEAETLVRRPREWPRSSDFTRDMMVLDVLTYLPDDILVKLDRATMGVSLEGRVPMLDHRLVEFALSLPTDVKIRDGKGKWVLRQVLSRYVPEELFERPKKGFSVPIGDWLRGPLRGWAESLIDESRLKQEGYLDPSPIRRAWSEHAGGNVDRSAQLWTVFMFQAWLETQRDSPCREMA